MLPVQLALDTQKRNNPNDQHLQEFVARQDWRAALKFIDRIAKKNPSLRLSVNHCLISLVSADVERTERGWLSLRDLVEKGQPITELEILDAIEKTIPEFLLSSLGTEDFISNMWKRASDALPKDKQILECWFDSCCRRRNFVQASTISLRASKTFETKYTYHWRAVACRFLDSQYGDAQNRQISGKMARALLDQSLKVTKEPDSSSMMEKKNVDVRSIAVQNAMDVRLAIRIYKLQSPEVALTLLHDTATTGLRSKVGGGNWELVLEKIKLLTEADKHEDLWKFSYQLLCDAAGIDSSQDGTTSYSFGKTADDMTVWKAIVLSCHKLGDIHLFKKLQSLLVHPALKKRHRALAGIDLSLMFKDGSPEFSKEWSPLLAVDVYLEHFVGTAVAYSDLRSFVSRFSETEREELLSKLSKSKHLPPPTETESSLRVWMFAELNELKFTYTFKVSNPANCANISLMDTFSKNCLELYSLSLVLEKELAVTERRTGDEAAILAACTLIHMYKAGVSEAQLQATMVLEKLLEHSKHHYGAIVMLVRLYLRQGVFSRAYEHYQRLDLKNIQLYTETWILLDRIASIFPYLKQEPNYAVSTLLTKHATYMQNKKTSSHRLVELYQDKGNYIGLCDVYEFLNRCEKSTSRAITLAELSRFDHRNQLGDFKDEDSPLGTVIDILPAGISNATECDDIHSSAAFPNYEHIEAVPMERVINLGPPIGAMWISCEQAMFRFRRWILRRETIHNHPNTSSAAHAQRPIKRSIALLDEVVSGPNRSDHLTTAELFIGRALLNMYSVHVDLLTALSTHAAVKTSAEGKNWVTSALYYYELSYKPCFMAMVRALNLMKTTSKVFQASPVSVLDGSQWTTLHNYYKLTEIFMVFPIFMTDMIKNAKTFKEIAERSSINTDDWDSINISLLEKRLKDFLWESSVIVNNFYDGARQVDEYWGKLENTERLVQGVRGNGPLARLLDEAWAKDRCAEVIKGWQDSMRGIQMEDKNHWWSEVWSGLSCSA